MEKSSGRNKPPSTPSYLIMGRHCIEEVLAHAPERFLHLYALHDKGGGDRRNDSIIQSCEQLDIPVTRVGRSTLDDMVNSDSHQSFVAMLKPRPAIDLNHWLKSGDQGANSLILALDGVQDPQNLGALLRAAECFGVDAVVWSKNRGSEVTPVVTKSSVGASELLTIIGVSNLAQSLERFKGVGYWVVSADANPKAEKLGKFVFPARTVLILGAEGEGIQPLLLKESDHTVRIPLQGKISSLNVSQAASVLMADWSRHFGA